MMEQPVTTQQANLPAGQGQRELPNATTILVLGILSLVLCGLIGLVLSIIGLNMAKKTMELYNLAPHLYTKGSYNNLTSGKTCATIGVILSSLVLLAIIVYIVFWIFLIGAIFSGAAASQSIFY